MTKIASTALLLGFLALVEPGVAWAAPVATGTAICPVQSGSGTLSPGLTDAGGPGGVKINFTAKLGPTPLAGCSGSAMIPGALVTITGGTLTGSGFFNGPAGSTTGNSCVNFDGPDVLGMITAKVVWSASIPIAPSKVIYKHGSPAVGGAPTDTVSLPAPGTITIKHGSFHTPVLPEDINLTTDIPSTCPGEVPPGITTFTITGGKVSL
jgi:hypothetical protein